jgi:hypothetical protein
MYTTVVDGHLVVGPPGAVAGYDAAATSYEITNWEAVDKLWPTKAPAAARQRALVAPVLLELYSPDGEVPDHISTAAVRSAVCKKLKERGVEDSAMPSWHTVNRELGRE